MGMDSMEVCRMRRDRRIVGLVGGALLLALFVVPARAAQGVNLSGLSGLLVSTSARPLPAERFVVSGGGFYGTADRVDTYAVPLILSYGILENLEVGLSLPLVTGVDPDNLPSTSGVGDLGLSVKYAFLEETQNVPAASAALRLKLPTADDGDRLGTGGVDAGILFAAGKAVGRADFMLNVEYALIGGDDPLSGRDLENEVNYAVGVGYDYTETLRLSLELLDQGFILNNFIQGDLLLAGVRFEAAPRLTIGGALGIGLTDPSTDVVFGGTVSYAFDLSIP